MIFRQLFDDESWTYTYLLADPLTREAVLIDTVDAQVERDVRLVDELDLKLRFVLDTHVHADHVTGAGRIRARTGARSVTSAGAGVGCVDLSVEDGSRVGFGRFEIEVRRTPGHTAGCLTFVVRDGDRTLAFTGDAVLVRGCGRTDFQQGDASTLYRSVREKVFSLPDDTLIYPAHDYRGHTCSTVAEEKAHNPRLKLGTSEAEFVEIMNNLDLPDPKLMDIAVPANLACGGVGAGGFREEGPDAIGPIASYRVVDVREPAEFDGPLGHVPSAELVPLGSIEAAAADWDRAQPVLLVCKSGRRLAIAGEMLAGMGFSDVTNLAGGMLAWNDLADGGR